MARLGLAPLVAAHALLPASAATRAIKEYGRGASRVHPYVFGLMTLVGAVRSWLAVGFA